MEGGDFKNGVGERLGRGKFPLTGSLDRKLPQMLPGPAARGKERSEKRPGAI